jgi:hypothetical protein
MIAPVQDSSMTSWPYRLPSGNQKRFQRDSVRPHDPNNLDRLTRIATERVSL